MRGESFTSQNLARTKTQTEQTTQNPIPKTHTYTHTQLPTNKQHETQVFKHKMRNVARFKPTLNNVLDMRYKVQNNDDASNVWKKESNRKLLFAKTQPHTHIHTVNKQTKSFNFVNNARTHVSPFVNLTSESRESELFEFCFSTLSLFLSHSRE